MVDTHEKRENFVQYFERVYKDTINKLFEAFSLSAGNTEELADAIAELLIEDMKRDEEGYTTVREVLSIIGASTNNGDVYIGLYVPEKMQQDPEGSYSEKRHDQYLRFRHIMQERVMDAFIRASNPYIRGEKPKKRYKGVIEVEGVSLEEPSGVGALVSGKAKNLLDT